MRTLKIERIRAAEITHERYDIPADFDPGKLLRDAWGIWYTDSEPVEVVLRFHPHVALRVKETRWHPSQRIEEQPDGYLLWRAQVAEPQEMLPWVRGWGAECEVVEPAELREALEREVGRLMVLYQVAELPKPPLYQLLWAKADRKTGRMHPLICHMLDVAVVALALWNEVLTDGIRKQFANALGLDTEATGRLLAFWAALHDLGKASPAFQRQVKPLEAALSAAGLHFPEALFAGSQPSRDDFGLGAWSKCCNPRRDWHCGLQNGSPQLSAGITGPGHSPARRIELKTDQVGGSGWDEVRRELVRTLVAVLKPPALAAWIVNRTDENTFLTLFSGLTSVADWIGSAETYFPIRRVATRSTTLRRADSGSGAAGVGRPGLDGLSAAGRGATF